MLSSSFVRSAPTERTFEEQICRDRIAVCAVGIRARVRLADLSSTDEQVGRCTVLAYRDGVAGPYAALDIISNDADCIPYLYCLECSKISSCLTDHGI